MFMMPYPEAVKLALRIVALGAFVVGFGIGFLLGHL